ncbi:hypothetical protein [Oribacterium sp. P6A1]|uniref:hypothetical protein n=1 Tax=Oribacterium sp. P6A1 TaxID=1410612 RepID=UPI00056758DB|nr:hypothetical protein [Oribacterium sp. P6A1]
MKKRLAFLLAVLMAVFSLGMVSLAKEKNVTEMSWSDGEKAVKESGIKGSFVTLDEVDLKFWIPNDYKATTLTKADKDEGYIAYYENPKTKGVVAVMYVDVKGMTLDEYKKELKGMSEVTEIEDCVLNGLECVGYRIPDDDTMSLSFSTENGYILEITFAPVTDDDDSIEIPAYIMSSIMEEE